MTDQPTPRTCDPREHGGRHAPWCVVAEQPTPRTEGSRDLNFIRECVALNPGGYTREFRFLLDTVNRLEAVAQARTEALRLRSIHTGDEVTPADLSDDEWELAGFRVLR